MWASTLAKGIGALGKSVLDNTKGGQLINAAKSPGDMEAKGAAVGKALASGRGLPQFNQGFMPPSASPSGPAPSPLALPNAPQRPGSEMLALNPMTSQEIMDKYLSY